MNDYYETENGKTGHTKEATTELNVFYCINKNKRHRIPKNTIHEKYTESLKGLPSIEMEREKEKHASDNVDLHDQ